MREIEFRWWSKRYNRMFNSDSELRDFIEKLRKDDNYDDDDYFTTKDELYDYLACMDLTFNIKETLDCIPIQYTGLKDKNGVKIFEGDIIKYPDNDDPYYIGVVEYGHFNCSCCHAVFGFTTVNNKGYEIDMLVANENNCTPLYEVVGNIYENKELLNG